MAVVRPRCKLRHCVPAYISASLPQVVIMAPGDIININIVVDRLLVFVSLRLWKARACRKFRRVDHSA